jgi:murein DD-endopeptidase MepM/ murein hydrolase activator NlpD
MHGNDPMQQEIAILHRVSSGSNTAGYDEYFLTSYAHMSTRVVEAGDKVTAGQLIGRSGDTGCSTAPHLHFGVERLSNTARSLFHGSIAKLGEVVIDPWGWDSPSGSDPWGTRAYPLGAFSVNLWKPGYAPVRPATWQ